MGLRNISKVSNLRIAVGITMLTILLLVCSAIAATPNLSNSGGESWQYYREITVKESSGNTLTNYQVFVQLSGSNFPTTTSNGADIRFTDANGNEMSYWIENWDYTGKSGSIWVKVQNIPSNGNTILKMYYGNTNARGVSNGETTFDFFDDFLGITLDTNKWTTGGYGIYKGVFYDISDGSLNLWSDNIWRILRMNIVLSPSQKVVVETKFLKTADSNWHQSFLVQNDAIDSNRLGFLDTNYAGSNMGIQKIATGGGSYPKDFGIFDSNAWYISRIIKKSDTTIYIDALNSDRRSINNYETTQPLWSSLTWTWVSWQYETIHVKFDWIFVRKYASQEPIITLGTEQPATTPTPIPTPTPTTAPPTTGSISISSAPLGAKIYLDSVYKGNTPKTIDYVSAGDHLIELTLNDYNNWVETITVEAGRTIPVAALLTPGASVGFVTPMPTTSQITSPIPTKTSSQPSAPTPTQTSQQTPIVTPTQTPSETPAAIITLSEVQLYSIIIFFLVLAILASIYIIRRNRKTELDEDLEKVDIWKEQGYDVSELDRSLKGKK